MIPDGVYIGLSAEDYFAEDAIGSSDIIRLHQRAEGFWWASRMNPDYRDTNTKAKTYGTALHAILLEGVQEYEERFAVAPEAPEGSVSTITQMKAALEAGGFSVKGTSGWAKEDWEAAMAANLPDRPCLGNIMRQWERERGARETVSAVEDRQLRIMRTVAMSNPEIKKLLADDDHPPLAEVSVFWTNNGVRFRARFDRLYPSFTMDLKSLGNWHGRPLGHAVGDAIARGGYDVQRAYYDVARLEMYRHLAEGALHGGIIEQRHWLHQFPALAPKWDWLWVFFQKPSAQGHAPIIFPVLDDQNSDIHRYGNAKMAKAIALYRRCMATFGREIPWARVEQLHHTNQEYDPCIVLPHWVQEESPVEADAYGG